MKKLLFLLVSLFMFTSSFAGKWTGNASYNVSDDGNMRCSSSDTKFVETGEVSGSNWDNSISINTDVVSDISVTISGDSHFHLVSTPTTTRAFNDYAYAYIYYTFDASELAPSVTPYTATVTITRGDQEVSCSLSATVTGEPAPTAGAILNGEFSVSATKKVKFTRGNLYWNGNDWAIESAQTRFRKSWAANHVSHFFWTNTADEAYAANMTSSLSENDVLFCDGSDAEHMITAESATNLYALSSAEWNYLINGRANASNLYRYPVTIDGNNYFVIAPDDYEGEINTYYSAEDFLTEQEKGLVCLAPSGRREGTQINPGDCACWTSTIDPNSYGQAAFLFNAHNAYIPSPESWENRVEIESYSRNYYQGPGYGFALRLVQNVSGSGDEGDDDDDPQVDPITASLIIATEKPVSFSVSANKKVQFTRGNLFWDGENWNAEATQYDFPTTYSSTHVGHFYWLSDAAEARAENYSYNASAYDPLFCDATNPLTIEDIDGENVAGLYNMSVSEWQYLLGNTYPARANATNLRKFPVTVAGHENCLVLAPDGFTGAIADSYTADEWTEIEYTKGLVCLPLTGYRNDGADITVDNSLGYWTGEGYSNNTQARKLEATGEYSITAASMDFRWYALPIRLVKEYNDPDLVPMPESEPVLSGVFRVNHNKYVKFTRGNLYWDGSDWKMESQQNYRPATIANNHLGFFYWTTDADHSHAGSYPNVVKNVTDNFFCDGSDEDHMLTVEEESGLFALSDNEWFNLLNRHVRSGGQPLHRFPVTVSGVPNCLVLAPDDFEGTLKDSYSRDEFITAQAEGIVCLPPTGYNYSGSYISNQDQPYLWIAQPDQFRDTHARQLYAYMSGETGYVSNASASARRYRLPIRLVQEQVYPTCEYKIKVKVPESEGEDYIPGISGSFNSFKVERLIPTNEPGWYTYTIKEPQSSNTGVFFITEYKVSGNVGSNHVRKEYTYVPGTEYMAKYFEYSCSEGRTFVEDLSDASWSSYSYHQGVSNRVREIHFTVANPTEGATIPAIASVKVIKQDGQGARTEEDSNVAISLSYSGTYNTSDVYYVDGNYYQFSANYSTITGFGNRTNTRYFWHLGDVVEETTSYTSPMFKVTTVELTKDLEDVTLDVSDNCTLSAIGDASQGHTFNQIETSAWRIYIDGVWENAHTMGKFSIFDIQHDDHNASLSFPATALPAGEYKFRYQYGASVDGNIFDVHNPETYGYEKYILSHDAIVTIKEGTMVNTGAGPAMAMSFAPGWGDAPKFAPAPVSYEYTTGTTILTDVVTDAGSVESVIRNNEKGAIIKLNGTNSLAASQSGIETAESIVVQGAAGQNTISAPKALYTPRSSADVVLTLSDINLELTGTSVISGFSNLILDGCEIISPAGAHYDTENRMLVDGSGNEVTNAVIRRSAPDYEREIANAANVGTICLPYAVAEGDYAGATFFELVSYADNELVFQQVTELEAGMPYVFLPEAEAASITCYYSGEEALTAGNKNGLYGSYTREPIGGDDDNYVIINNQCRKVGANTYVGANRAYIKLSQVPNTTPTPPMGAMLISIPCDENDPTDITEVEAELGNVKTVKLLKDNQIIIISNGEVHSVDGKRTK